METGHIILIVVAILHIIVFLSFLHYRKLKKSQNTETAVSTNSLNLNQTRNNISELQNTNRSYNTQTKSFLIPSSLKDKVFLNEVDQFIFTQSGTIQVGKKLDQKYYFELMFYELPVITLLFIGLAPFNFSTSLVPGLCDKTVSLESSRGELYKDGNILQYNPVGRFKQGDVLGVSIQTTNNFTYKIQFTKNGIPVSPIKFNVEKYLTPTIHSTANCRFSVNFGETEFIYDPELINNLVNIGPSANLPPSYEHI